RNVRHYRPGIVRAGNPDEVSIIHSTPKRDRSSGLVGDERLVADGDRANPGGVAGIGINGVADDPGPHATIGRMKPTVRRCRRPSARARNRHCKTASATWRPVGCAAWRKSVRAGRCWRDLPKGKQKDTDQQCKESQSAVVYAYSHRVRSKFMPGVRRVPSRIAAPQIFVVMHVEVAIYVDVMHDQSALDISSIVATAGEAECRLRSVDRARVLGVASEGDTGGARQSVNDEGARV